MPMTNEDAALRLKVIHTAKLKASANVTRKRSWRESEKAMTLAALAQEREALELAYKALTGRNMLAQPKAR